MATTRALASLTRRTAFKQPLTHSSRLLSTTPSLNLPKPLPSTPRPASTPPAPKQTPKKTTLEEPPQTWLAGYVQRSPVAMGVFLRFLSLFGYGRPEQIAVRRMLALYEVLCAGRAEEDAAFWRDNCSLPPTFQSWFTITNLHIWLLTVRLRALPKPAGQHHTQALIDHFFYDIEDRIRLVLRAHPSRGPSLPLSIPSSSPSSPTRPPSGDGSTLEPFYTTPQGNLDANGKPIRQYAPERLVTSQMKVLKEQWSGLTLSLDLGLIRGDAELAGAIWRNFLGARGAKGIVLPWEGMTKEEDEGWYRRSVNAVGSDGEVKKVEKRGLDVEERSEDYSGVSDYRPSEADKYVAYPETMARLVEYIRRELARLEKIPDEEIMGPQKDSRGLPFPQVSVAQVNGLRFGRVVGEVRK